MPSMTPQGRAPSSVQSRALAASWWLAESATEEEAVAGFRAAHPTLDTRQVRAAFSRAQTGADLGAAMRDALESGIDMRMPRGGVAVVQMDVPEDDDSGTEAKRFTIYVPYAAGETVAQINARAGQDVMRILNDNVYEISTEAALGATAQFTGAFVR
jgi:hypothetical protein